MKGRSSPLISQLLFSPWPLPSGNTRSSILSIVCRVPVSCPLPSSRIPSPSDSLLIPAPHVLPLSLVSHHALLGWPSRTAMRSPDLSRHVTEPASPYRKVIRRQRPPGPSYTPLVFWRQRQVGSWTPPNPRLVQSDGRAQARFAF